MTADPAATADVLVIGGGPAGSTAAAHLAQRGYRVIVVERQVRQRTEPHWALLTPRTIAALRELELVDIEPYHVVRRVRLTHSGRSVTTTWPSGGSFPAHAAVALRAVFDHGLLGAAVAAGATALEGHEASDPIIERGFARGATVTAPDGGEFEARAEYTIVADGASSRFGRALGTSRRPTWPYALAHQMSFRSALHDGDEVELLVDLRDLSDTPITGYGWMLPSGDGHVTVGVMMMSTSPSFQVVNPVHLLERMIIDHGNRWQLGSDPIGPGAGGRIPLGLSVGPSAGPTYLLIGDAVGAGNPMTGTGIEAALATGTMAATVIDEALRSGSSAALQQYTKLIEEQYGSYYRVGRLTSQLFGQPSMSSRVGRLVARRRPAADGLLRLAANELRPGRLGLAEVAYRAGRAVSLVAPDA
jgi:geranylgeranyl reductase family protein